MILSIVSMEGLLYEGEAKEVYAPGEGGELGIYDNHTPIIATLKPGEVRYVENDQMNSTYISGGILEVKNNAVVVFSDTAVRSSDLDEKKILEAKKDAERALGDHLSNEEVASTEAAIAQAIAQLRLIEKYRKG